MFFACGQKKGERTDSEKPNIIFILTDDQRWDALGSSGNEVIHTPEMDRLADEGIYFRNAFVTTPICAASRASILTGRYERTHGYTFQQKSIKEPYIKSSYPSLMKGTGYHTGFFGKFGVEYDSISSLFDESESYDRNNKYKDRRGYYYKMIAGDTVHLTRYTGQKALDFINSAPEEKPFCLSLSFSAPHAHDGAPEQYFWQHEADSLYQDYVFDPPRMSEEKWFNEQPQYIREGENRMRWHWRYSTPAKYQESVKGYYRMIADIDHEIGKIRQLLEEKGMADNTVFILMGDNGYFLGERQLAGKWLMYEPSLRVPLILFDPRNNKPRKIEDLVLNIDVPSTILELAQLDIPEAWQGISLAGYAKGEDPAAKREMFLCEHLWEYDPIPGSEGIRTKEWKYFRYRDDLKHEELYNLVEDPHERNNLSEVQEFAGVLKKMRLSTDSIISNCIDEKLTN